VSGEGAGLLARGDASSAALVDREAAGGGWIDYAIVNPVSGQVQAKASWVQQLDDGLVVGCGIYRDKAAASSPTAAATAASPTPQSRSAGIGKAPSPARRAAVAA
jgi:signal transduction histidine kinase